MATAIRTSEDRFIHERVGSRIFVNIQSQIINYMTGGTMNADYKVLIDDYVTPALMWYSILEYIPYSSFKFRNKGTQYQNSENSTSIPIADLSYLESKVQAAAMFYGDRMITYLRNNTTLFPEYYNTEAGDIQPSLNDTTCGIYVPNSNRGFNCSQGMGFGIDIN